MIMQPNRIRLFIYLIIACIVSALVGTYIHEFGHYIVARYFGFNAEINYGRTSLIPSNITVPPKEDFFIYSGGPLITMLSGTIGFLLLLRFNKSFQSSAQLNIRQWVLIFLSLFWSIETIQFLALLAGYFTNGHFHQNSDEVRIATYLDMPPWTIPAFTAFIGAVVFFIVILKFIPKSIRALFIASGLIAGTVIVVTEVLLQHKFHALQP